MPKCKAVAVVKEEVNADVELSPPPDGLLEDIPVANGIPKTASRKRKAMNNADDEPQPVAKRARKRKTKVEAIVEEVVVKTEVDGEASGERKVKRGKRKTKEEKEAEAMPLAARTVGHKLFIGAHVSSAGGQSCST